MDMVNPEVAPRVDYGENGHVGVVPLDSLIMTTIKKTAVSREGVVYRHTDRTGPWMPSSVRPEGSLSDRAG